MPDPAPSTFDDAEFDAAFRVAADRCCELNRAQAAEFVATGRVVVKDAFERSIAETICEAAWRELADKHDVDRNDPDSWRLPSMRGSASRSSEPGGTVTGYVRTSGTGKRYPLAEHAPRAFRAQADVIGGAERLPEGGGKLSWSDAAVGNLGILDVAWRPPSPRQMGWHKDGYHFRHLLNSPEQGLLTVPIYTEILPKSGGTFIATDSIGPVARLLTGWLPGLHPDGMQAGYLIPGLIEQCSRFEELTGEPGDVVLLHPYTLHRKSVNPSIRPRFIANAALVLAEPMRFDREPGDPYSLVELAVLHALGVPRFEYLPTRGPKAVTPFRFRDSDEQQRQNVLLTREKHDMARRGLLTPAWGPEFGYQSNAA